MRNGLKFLLMADGLSTLALGMIGPIYAIFVEEIGGDLLDASWAYFVFTITSGVVLYLMAKWEDKVRHKEKLVAGGYFLTALGCLGYLFVTNQMTLLAVQAVLGLSIAILSPAFDAMYSHFVISRQEASDWGTWEAMGYITAALGALAGGYIASEFGFRTLFMVMFVAALLGAIVSLFLFNTQKYLRATEVVE